MSYGYEEMPQGEVPPGDPDWLVKPSEDHFTSEAHKFNRGITKGHEVATIIGNTIVSVYEDNKIVVDVTVATLGVAGVLLAAKELRRRYKK